MLRGECLNATTTHGACLVQAVEDGIYVLDPVAISIAPDASIETQGSEHYGDFETVYSVIFAEGRHQEAFNPNQSPSRNHVRSNLQPTFVDRRHLA